MYCGFGIAYHFLNIIYFHNKLKKYLEDMVEVVCYLYVIF